MPNLAIFASGTGTNARTIIDYFKDHKKIAVKLVVCNKPQAGVLEIAADRKIPVLLIEKERFFQGDAYLQQLAEHQIHFIVLAGFLWKVPLAIIEKFRNRIINIHPALLPKYGGKGMYGAKVHEAVLKAGDRESGITIHYVDEVFDNGEIIFQSRCAVEENDTPDRLAARIHQLEHSNYPKIIEKAVNLQIPS